MVMCSRKPTMKTRLEKRAAGIILICLLFLILLAFCSLFIGRYMVAPGEVLSILWRKIWGSAETSIVVNVVWDIRLSRVLLNMIVGAGLAVSGAAFQGIFQNRLVSPDILGVSSGAGFGAALGILLAFGLPSVVTTFAFAFGLISVLMTYAVAKTKKDRSTLSLVLSGIVIASLFNALLSFVKLVADTDSALPAITYWLMGSFTGATFEKVLLAGIPVFIGLALLFALRWKINLLSMGDEEAYTLGIHPAKNRLIIIGACTLITAACVTVTGIIGWIGMILPNICREFISADNRYLIPASAVTGALFMVIVDFMARMVAPSEIPVGILTALVGAPLFILIYRKDGGSGI